MPQRHPQSPPPGASSSSTNISVPRHVFATFRGMSECVTVHRRLSQFSRRERRYLKKTLDRRENGTSPQPTRERLPECERLTPSTFAGLMSIRPARKFSTWVAPPWEPATLPVIRRIAGRLNSPPGLRSLAPRQSLDLRLRHLSKAPAIRCQADRLGPILPDSSPTVCQHPAAGRATRRHVGRGRQRLGCSLSDLRGGRLLVLKAQKLRPIARARPAREGRQSAPGPTPGWSSRARSAFHYLPGAGGGSRKLFSPVADKSVPVAHDRDLRPILALCIPPLLGQHHSADLSTRRRPGAPPFLPSVDLINC